MKRIALASSLLLAIAFGCGEPKAPPPGAPTDKMDAPSIDLNPTDTTAPTEDDKAGAPTDSSTEKDSSAGEPGEK